MKTIAWMVLIIVVIFSAGCAPVGSDLKVITDPGPSPSPIGPASNWDFVGSVGGRDFGFALQLIGTNVAGYVHIFDEGAPPCFDYNQAFALSGTTGSDGNTTMSSQLRSGTLTVRGRFDSSRSQFAGTYSFTGGCADGDSGPLVGNKFQPVTGLYEGTLTSSFSSTGLSAQLAQSSDLDSGFLEVKGTLAFTSLSCTAQYPVSGFVAGHSIFLFFYPSPGDTETVYGNVSQDAMQLDLADIDGSCGGGGYGTLTLQ